MSEPQSYPVFFDCEDPDEKKIQKYFQIKRKSGGGECSAITNVSGKVYRIDFKDKEAQQRVLAKREHLLEISGTPVVLIVRDKAEAAGAPPITSPVSGPKHQPPASPLLHSISAESLPSGGEEHEVNLDSYLLQYLTDSHQAGSELDRELQPLQSSAKLCPEKGKVVVRSLVQFDDEAVKTWKRDVEKVFEIITKRYRCHFETDAKMITLLLKSCSVCQDSDDVKVYSESGMAVVVGESSQVDARLKHAADLHARGRGASLGRNHSSVRRLGDAKLRLLRQEIYHSMGQNYPNLRVTQKDSGQLVLEGPVDEVRKANDVISEIEKKVQEKKVADMSTRLLAFLFKMHYSTGMLSDFLGCRNSVEIELKTTELRLFSLSAKEIEQTVQEIKDKFKEMQIEVSNSIAVPAELCELLTIKMESMNETGNKVQVAFTDNKVSLLGHAAEVDELYEAVTEYILDQSNIEDRVVVPIPELAPRLQELLSLHGFDFAGVNFHPKKSGLVALEGPAGAVKQLRSQLGPFMQSLIKENVVIDMPGALRCFKSQSGGEKLLTVASSNKCLVQFAAETCSSAQCEEEVVARYFLKNGLQVVVCVGDITKQEADALVNAANEDLKHMGGVALALSKAGGPEVQKESSELVKREGKVMSGEVVMTTGGKLKCKKLLHAVGPVQGKAGGRERILINKVVESSLVLAESMDFRSIAFPCISSGVFGVPIDVCAEAIVSAVRAFGAVGGRSVNIVTLIDKRREVVSALRQACDRLLQDISSENTAVSVESQTGAAAGGAGDGLRVEIIQGTIETQQADCLVCPMFGHNPGSIRVGQDLQSVVGPTFKTAFNQASGGATLPGDTVLVERMPGLLSKAVIFMNLISNSTHQQDQAKQILGLGIHRALLICETKGFRSVAFPVIGPGVLQFPHSMAALILLQEIHNFEQKRPARTPFLIRIVIHPTDKDSSKALQAAQQTVHIRGLTNDANPNNASFYRHVSSASNEVTALMGSVKLQIVQGDITHEKTDVIVNSTGFNREQAGVSKAILTAAGPNVEAELNKGGIHPSMNILSAGVPADHICTTGGLLGCREIIHACSEAEPQSVSKTCKKILKLCESKGYTSAAFPAINTGIGKMDYGKACRAMLDGLAAAITESNLKSVSLIRIVILPQDVFNAFRSELGSRFGQVGPSQNWIGKLKKKCMTKSKSSRSGAHIPLTKPEPAILTAIGCSPDSIRALKKALEGLVLEQLEQREFDLKDLHRLNEMEVAAVQAKARVLGVSLEHSVRSSTNTSKPETRGRSNSEEKIIVLKGLREDVLSVTELVNKSIKKALTEYLQEQQEEKLAETVEWLFQKQQEDWEKFSVHQNYILEEAHKKNKVSEDVETPNGTKIKVNLKSLEATDWDTGNTYRVRRCETHTDIELPENWKPMAGDNFKKAEVDPSSMEYQHIALGFHKTAKYKIHKIERVQNFHLWHSYFLMRQKMLAKNGIYELGEKYLYHGTSAESCNCIERDRFDRGYTGTHGTVFSFISTWTISRRLKTAAVFRSCRDDEHIMLTFPGHNYGKGVYFAVNAAYSANNNYSKPDAKGQKRMYVARVLTGRYTVGSRGAVAPPPRGNDPTDKYDSLVDDQLNPNMFVIFHDDQAYPEYLITFS